MEHIEQPNIEPEQQSVRFQRLRDVALFALSSASLGGAVYVSTSVLHEVPRIGASLAVAALPFSLLKKDQPSR